MKQSIFTSTILCTALVLTACGGSDDNTSNAGDTSNPPPNANAPIQNGVLNYSVFDIYSENEVGGKNGWGRIDIAFRNGSFSETKSTVVGTPSYESSLTKDDIDYATGNNFFFAMPSDLGIQTIAASLKILDGNNLEFTYPNSDVRTMYNFVAIDISGKGKNVPNPKTGIVTDLDNYTSYFKSTNYAYPQGSVCYVANSKTNKPLYAFYKNAQRDQETLEQWLADEKNTTIRVNGNTQPVQIQNVIYEKVGMNNELPAVRYQDQLGIYHAAVIYQGTRYDATYTDGKNFEAPIANSDLSKGIVQCDLYNKVAADYLAEQMKLSYSQQ